MANDTNSVDALLQAAQFLEAANDGEYVWRWDEAISKIS